MLSRLPLSSLQLPKEAENNAARIIERIISGSTEVFTSPIGKDEDTDKILSGWDIIFNDGLSKMESVLIDIENSNRSKFGPRSIAKPWSERRERLYNYFGTNDSGRSLIMDSPISRRLRPLSYHAALTFLKNSTNSGLPFLVKKANVKDQLLENWKMLYEKEYPAMLFTRTQENNATRDVWGIDIATVLNEMRFYRPILDIQSKVPWRVALRSPEDVDDAMTKILKESARSKCYILSIDFSQYDASIKDGLQYSSFRYFSNMFQSKFSGELDDISRRFNNVGIYTPDGILTGQHGVPSGSTFTNEVDSVAQMLMACNSRYSYNCNLCQIQGDDGVHLSFDPENLMYDFTTYGVNVNSEKSVISRDYIIYLQNLYHPFYAGKDVVRGVYSTYRALNRIIFLERFDKFEGMIDGKDYFSIRTISILENCRNHPLFYDLVRYVWTLDKYKLKFSDLGLANYVKRKAYQEGKDVTFTNWSYGDDVGNIKSFKTFKILEELNRGSV